MAGIGDLVATLSMDNRGFVRGAKQAESISSSLANKLSSSFGAIAASVAGAFALDSLIGGAKEAVAAENKLIAVLSATGSAANLSASEIKDYAAQLQATTNFEDDATVSAAALLASFTNIKGDVFKQTLTDAADLATVMGTDLTSAVSLLGKVLQNPADGLARLRKVGVDFTDAEENQIKTLVAAGDTMRAQEVILASLEGRFKGAAAAVADPFTQLKNNVGDVGETLGGAMLPVINSLSIAASGWLVPMNALLAQNTDQLTSMVKIVIAGAAAFAAIKIATLAYAAAQRIATMNAITFQAVINPATLVKIAIGITGATLAIKAMDAAMNNVANAGDKANKNIAGLAGALKDAGNAAPEITKVSDAVRTITELQARVNAGDDPKRLARDKFIAELAQTANPNDMEFGSIAQHPLVKQYDALIQQLDAVTEANDRWKKSQEDSRREEDRVWQKIGDHQKASAELKDEIDVLTGAITKEEAAINSLRRQGYDQSQAESLAALQMERDKLASQKKTDPRDTATQLAKASLQGSSEAASIMLRGVGGGSGGPEKIQKDQLTQLKKIHASLSKQPARLEVSGVV